MRLIGDIHDNAPRYLEIVSDCDRSIQVGDMAGYNYDFLNGLDVARHRFFRGNHDNYDLSTPYDLGDFGVHDGWFFIRGAFSIDVGVRVAGTDWWPQEEMNYLRMKECLEEYRRCKPRFVVSHDCPLTVSRMITAIYGDWILKNHRFDPDTFQTQTQLLLEDCFRYHQPEAWFFGHYHKNMIFVAGRTHFQCIDKLDYVDVHYV